MVLCLGRNKSNTIIFYNEIVLQTLFLKETSLKFAETTESGNQLVFFSECYLRCGIPNDVL